MSITQGVVTQMRAASERTMVARCTILRATSATPRPGYETETFTTHLSNVPCYLYGVRVTERDSSDRRSAITTSRLIVPRGTDVTSDDRVSLVTLFDGTLLSDPDGVEIRVTPNPAHLIIDLVGVS